MSGLRIWQCELLQGGCGGRARVWTHCTATLYRSRPRLVLETGPFSIDNQLTSLNINANLELSFQSPISVDFTLFLKTKEKDVTIAFFCEQDANSIIDQLVRLGAIVYRNESQKTTATSCAKHTSQHNENLNIEILKTNSSEDLKDGRSSSFTRPRQYSTLPKDLNLQSSVLRRQPHTPEHKRKVKLSRRRSTGNWLKQRDDFKGARNRNTSIWYVEEDSGEEDEVFNDPKQQEEERNESVSVQDGLVGNYFATLPRATRHLFRSEVNLHKSSSILGLDKKLMLKPDSPFTQDNFRPELLGLYEDPGVVQFHIDDYPETEEDDALKVDDMEEPPQPTNNNNLGEHADNDEEPDGLPKAAFCNFCGYCIECGLSFQEIYLISCLSCGHCSSCCAEDKKKGLKREDSGAVRHLQVDSEEEIEVQVVNSDHWTTREIDVDHYVLLSDMDSSSEV